MLLVTDAHCLEAETIAAMAKNGVEIEDRTQEPWHILFRGSEAALKLALAEHWGYDQQHIAAIMEDAVDTDVDVRNATAAVLEAAAHDDDAAVAIAVVQKSIFVSYGDNASVFFKDEVVHQSWAAMRTSCRAELLRKYVEFERSLVYPVGFKGSTHHTLRGYRREFPEFGEMDVSPPHDFYDESFGNNACPSFACRLGDGTVHRVIIWIGAKDAALREAPDDGRFMLEVRDPEDNQSLKLSTEKWGEVLLWARIEIMKSQIRQDVDSGRVPADVASFGDLGNYVDENCYGGFCEDDGFPEGWTPDGQMTEEMHAFVTSCGNAVDAWIKTGGINPDAGALQQRLTTLSERGITVHEPDVELGVLWAWCDDEGNYEGDYLTQELAVLAAEQALPNESVGA